jgi:hypothetical protein
MRYIALAFLAAALSGSAVAAADSPDTPKAEKPKKEKRICKSSQSSHSRMGSYVCKTAAEWAKDGESRELSSEVRSERPNR